MVKPKFCCNTGTIPFQFEPSKKSEDGSLSVLITFKILLEIVRGVDSNCGNKETEIYSLSTCEGFLP